MKTSLYLALAVCFVYAIQTCTCATTAKQDPIFAFDKDCLDENIGHCKEEVEQALRAVRELQPSVLKTIVGKCGTAETKQCLTFDGGVRPTGKCPNFLKNIEQELRSQVDGEMEC